MLHSHSSFWTGVNYLFHVWFVGLFPPYYLDLESRFHIPMDKSLSIAQQVLGIPHWQAARLLHMRVS